MQTHLSHTECTVPPKIITSMLATVATVNVTLARQVRDGKKMPEEMMTMMTHIAGLV